MYVDDVMITETLLAITWATSLWFLLCWLFSRTAVMATFQRTVWRTALLGTFILTTAELSGLTAGIHWWMRTCLATGKNTIQTVANAGRATSGESAHVFHPSDQPDFKPRAREGNESTGAATLAFDFYKSSPLRQAASYGDVGLNTSGINAVGRARQGSPDPAENVDRRSPAALGDLRSGEWLGQATGHGSSWIGSSSTWLTAGIGSVGFSHYGAILLGIWLLGTAVLLLKITWEHAMLTWFQLRQPLTRDNEIVRRTRRLANQLRIRRQIALRSSDRLATPVAFGTWRPTIVLPSAFAEQFSDSHQDVILAHELTHLSAHDPFWQLTANLVCALLWWQPLAWVARKRLQSASEWAADEATTLIPNGPELLAECLVKLGRRLVPGRRLQWLSAAGPHLRSGLGRRVTRLLSLKPDRDSAVPRLRNQRIAIAVMLMFSLSATGWARSHSIDILGDREMTILTKSWRQSVACAAVLAAAGFVGSDLFEARAQEGDRADVAVEFSLVAEDAEAALDDVNFESERDSPSIIVGDEHVEHVEHVERVERVEHRERREQYKEPIQDEAARNHVEEIHKQIHDRMAELPEDSRHEIAELIEALLHLERSNMEREIRRSQKEMRGKMEEHERRAVEQARALEKATRDLQLGKYDKALEEVRRRSPEYQPSQYGLRHPRFGEMTKRKSTSRVHATSSDLFHDPDHERDHNLEDQLQELREQMSQMHRQMSDMQRAMEKLMRSSQPAGDRRR